MNSWVSGQCSHAIYVFYSELLVYNVNKFNTHTLIYKSFYCLERYNIYIPLFVGVSSYIPAPNDIIVFELIQSPEYPWTGENPFYLSFVYMWKCERILCP
mgnify:CR=1 FL=1